MKFKSIIFSFLIFTIFLSSSIPYSKNSLIIGQKIDSVENIISHNSSDDLKKHVLINFWSISDAESRIQNKRLSDLTNKCEGRIRYISICTDSDEKISSEILKNEIKDETGLYLFSKDIDNEIFKIFQTSKGMRHFLLDENFKLMNVEPDNETIESILG